MPDVRDLLIRMSLDNTTFKTNIADAKRELQTLKAEYKATASDPSLETAGAELLQNLKEQKTAAEVLVREYQKGLDEISEKLKTVTPGSQAESALIKQSQRLQKNMADAEASLNNLDTKIKNMEMDTLVQKAQQFAGFFSQLRLGFGPILEGAGQLADDAYQVYVSREAALTFATKNVEDARQTTEDIQALDQALQQMTTHMPRTYENLAELMGTGATLGVPYEDLLKFTEVMGKLETATTVQGGEGAQQMAQFVNLTEHSYENLDRISSALVALGNASATTESDILEMAHRAASGLASVGMKSEDILGLSAAMASVGVNAAAGGTSVSKLAVTMDKAANQGAQSIQPLLVGFQRLSGQKFDNIYDLAVYLDSVKSDEGWGMLQKGFGLTDKETKEMVNSALAAERFAQAMGMTTDALSQGWNQNSADMMLRLFDSLGQLPESQEASMLDVMDKLGITEVRQSNMVRALALNYALLASSMETARQGYQENVALENEAQRAYSTTEAQMAMNQNKAQNALAATGEPMQAWRKPFDDFFGNLEQWYASWPGWAQTAVAGVSDAMGKAGDALKTAGELSFSLTNIASMARDLRGLGKVGSVVGSVAKWGAIGLGAAALGAGAYGLAEYMKDVGDKTDDISKKLQGLKITVDDTTKNETLAAIAEVQAAADKLRGGEESADYANTSKIVQMGYGTASMYGTALGYESSMADRRLTELANAYGARIREQEAALLAATNEEGRAAAQASLDALEGELAAKTQEARAEYGAVLSSVINGAIRQAADPSALEQVMRDYSLLDMILSIENAHSVEAIQQNARALQQAFLDAGFTDPEFMNIESMLTDPNSSAMGAWTQNANVWAQMVYEVLSGELGEVFGNGQLMAVLSAALESGAFENADASGFSGPLLGLMQALDIKQIGDQNTGDWRDIGKNSMTGLGSGITENQATATGAASTAAQALVDTARSVLQIHSPSQVFVGIGQNVASGLAAGIYAGADEAIAAASWLAAQIEATMRSALEIHSPSGVARTLGGYIGAGLAQGISGSLGRLERVSGGLAQSVGGVANRAVNVTLNIDGQKMAQVLTPMVDQQISEMSWNQ